VTPESGIETDQQTKEVSIPMNFFIPEIWVGVGLGVCGTVLLLTVLAAIATARKK